MLEVSRWLAEQGLGHYADAFAENGIAGDILHELTDAELKELGLNLGDRKRLLKAIAALNVVPTADPLERAEAAAPVVPREAERRQLTVMVVDLVGSTTLSARLDPEDMAAVIRAYQKCCAQVIGRWGGHVAKYMGDGVLAYFGWPVAHEDEAERAIKAGLQLVDGVEKLDTPAGEPLGARVGVATGLVMVGELIGEGAAQEQTAVGETPNLAARLQALAAPGSVVISQATRRLVGGLFELIDLGPKRLKGFAEPLAAFRVEGEGRAEGRFEALHGEHLTPLVGREHELGILLERWAWAKDGDGQVVLLSGEPGIGKSRVIRALREHFGNEPYTPLSHYCSPNHTSSALHPVIGLLERAAQFDRDDPPEAQLDKLEAVISRSKERLGEVVPLLAALLGVPTGARYPALAFDPEVQKRRTLQVLVDQVAGLTAQRPVLVLYEDVHWIDPSTLELLDLVIERVPRLPVLALITFRPEFQPPWTGQAHVTTLTMSRLGRRQGADLVARVTGVKTLPAEVLDQIVARTDGVPLFVEELTKAVLESGLLVDAGDHYELSGPLPPLAIPTTLHDSLMARLDRLSPVKEIAQIGAVIGREFSHELLAAVADRPEDQLRGALGQLVRSELLFRRGTPPDATYVFKHALVQDAAYQSLLKAKRQHLHARIARSLEERPSSAIQIAPEVLAHHYMQAGLVELAIPYWLRAGQQAARRSADREAIAHLTKGLQLLEQLSDTPESATKELDLRVALGPVLTNIKGSAAPEVAEVYERAQVLCREVGGPEHAFPVLWGLWLNRNTSGRLRAAEELAAELIAVAEDLPQAVFKLQGHHAAWTTRFNLGEFALALEHVEHGVRSYALEGHHRSAFIYGGHDAGVCGYSNGAWISWLLGYPDRALGLAHEGLTLAKRLSHPISLAQALCYKAILHQLRGERELVREDADELLAYCAKHRLEIWASNGQMLKAWTLVAIGEVGKGLRSFQQALDERRGKGLKMKQAYYLAILAEALGLAGRSEKGLEVVDEALEVISSTEERRWEAIAHRVRGDLLLAELCRDEPAAEAAFRRAIEVAGDQEAKSLELRAAASLAGLWREQGRRAEAHDLLAPIYSWFTEGFDTADLKGARALLEELA